MDSVEQKGSAPDLDIRFDVLPGQVCQVARELYRILPGPDATSAPGTKLARKFVENFVIEPQGQKEFLSEECLISQVAKVRGMAPSPGLHTMRITKDGVDVFPRILRRDPDSINARDPRNGCR